MMKSKSVVCFASIAMIFAIGVLVGWLIWGAPIGGLSCPDGTSPDGNGCCAGEEYTDMGDLGFNCCPADESLDCFPPIK